MSTLWGPPGNLRLVVVDLETCWDGANHAIQIGVVVCRGGVIKERHERLVNPGVPVDQGTFEQHGISTADLAGEPSFDKVWPQLEHLFQPVPGETLVIGAHNVAFDLPILRTEISNAGLSPLPDVPLLDTMGNLRALGGLRDYGKGLKAVIAALGITNPHEHNALADATATAEAAIAMLARAEADGHTDLAVLLDACKDGRSATVSARSGGGILDRSAPVPFALPAGHVAAHARTFPAPLTPADETALGDLVRACAKARCGSLDGIGETTPPSVARRHLFAAFADRTAASDGPGAATVLFALAPLLADLPPALPSVRAECPGLGRVTGARDARGVALAVAAWIEATAAGLASCPDADPCPACRDGDPCPLDTWPDALVPLSIQIDKTTVPAFWNPRSGGANAAAKGAGRGYISMRRTSVPLADATLRACHRYYAATDPSGASALADQVWLIGCRDPQIAEARAMHTAAAGREADLRLAAADALATLALRGRSTHPAWIGLAARAAQIEARLLIATTPGSRRHAQQNAKRPPRTPRFLRT